MQQEERKSKQKVGRWNGYDNLCSWNKCSSFEAIKKLASNFSRGKKRRKKTSEIVSFTWKPYERKLHNFPRHEKLIALSVLTPQPPSGTRFSVCKQTTIACCIYSCELIYYANKFRCDSKLHIANNEKLFRGLFFFFSFSLFLILAKPQKNITNVNVGWKNGVENRNSWQTKVSILTKFIVLCYVVSTPVPSHNPFQLILCFPPWNSN